MPRTEIIAVDKIDTTIVVRERVDDAYVAELVERIRAGDTLPPPLVFHDSSTYRLADGHHRLAAASGAGLRSIECLIESGGLTECEVAAVAANKCHGLRRSPGDKRAAVKRALANHTMAGWSDRRLAEHAGVSHTFVAKLRRSVATLPIVDGGLGNLFRSAASVIARCRAEMTELAEHPRFGVHLADKITRIQHDTTRAEALCLEIAADEAA